MERALVVLLGMHRSGTSLAARCFEAAGLPMGERLLRDPVPDNPDGYREDADILAVHETLFSECFGRPEYAWRIEGLEDVAPPLCSDTAWSLALEKLASLIRDRLSKHATFGFKDPRTARLLPLWKTVARRLNLRVVPVLLIRHPAEVARSLEARNGISRALGELMWLRTNADILRATYGCLEAIIEYAKWFEEPARNFETIRRVLRTVGIQPRPIPTTFINDGYRHEQSVAVNMPLSENVYRNLVACDGHRVRKRVCDLLLNRIDSLTSAFGGWRALGEVLVQTRIFPEAPAISLALPDDFWKSDGMDEWRVVVGTPEVVNRNRWCRRVAGGYLLHANEPKNPPACLLWRDVCCSLPATFRMELVSGSALSPELGVGVEVRDNTAGTSDVRKFHVSPGRRIPVLMSLSARVPLEIQIRVEVGSAARNAYHAALIIHDPKVVRAED